MASKGAKYGVQCATLLLWHSRDSGARGNASARDKPSGDATKTANVRPCKEVAEHRYTQRVYAPDELNAIIDGADPDAFDDYTSAYAAI